MTIEANLTAILEAEVRQAEALEGIYACLQVIVKVMTAPTARVERNPDTDVGGPAHRETVEVDEDADPPVEEPKKPASRGSTRQRKNQEREEPEPPAEEEPGVDPLEDDQEPEAEVDPEDVRKALKSYRDINGSAALMKVLNDHGATGMGSLDPSKYASVLKAVK